MPVKAVLWLILPAGWAVKMVDRGEAVPERYVAQDVFVFNRDVPIYIPDLREVKRGNKVLTMFFEYLRH